jgi:hypothetical protein
MVADADSARPKRLNRFDTPPETAHRTQVPVYIMRSRAERRAFAGAPQPEDAEERETRSLEFERRRMTSASIYDASADITCDV